ncbi:MAG: TrkH family potassium uptake protein [Clostridia bacterium]|nr:TrkH family potassium uptake protein [Clostridia bacterium]
MNYKYIFNSLGKVLKLEAVLLLLPFLVSLVYRESSVALYILLTLILSLGLGFLLSLIFKKVNSTIFSKEGFILVAFSWISVSLISALPFYLTKEIPNFIDALFEAVSGFTTTGATILKNPENLSHGLLLLRSFNHFIGGMGIIVFITAIIPQSNDKSLYVLRAEMPGPIVDKIHPRSKNTAKILYLIYIGLTALLIILLLLGGMSFFESLVHAFATAGTGGFGIKVDGIASYSNYIKWVIAVFMLLFGINFNVYFLILIGKFTSAFKSKELFSYLLIVCSAFVLVSLNIYPLYNNLNDTIRNSFFQVSSIITTTGFSIANFNAWSPTAKTILLILMFIGGCSGSTAGGLKVFRISILFKRIKYELKRLIHPDTVEVMTFDGKKIDDKTSHGTASYLALYFIIIITVTLLVSIDGLSFEANFSAAVSCMNNIGPGFNEIASDYSAFSPFSKVVLTITMLLGRLEIYPILLAFSPYTWLKK